MHFPAALYLPADAFDVSSNQVIGRRIAGRLLTSAFASGLKAQELLTVFSPGQDGPSSVQQLIAGHTSADGVVRVGGEPDPDVIDEIGAIHFPDPSLARWVSLRRSRHHYSFSLTGVIHTVCSEGALSGLGDLPLAPVYPWDAVICTSTAGRAVVASAWEQRLEAMLARFHLDEAPSLSVGLPQLPVIPLAGPTEQPFEPQLSRSDRRGHARRQLGLPLDHFVVAFVGRLSFHSKCHPMALYRALDELAATHPDRPITLIECGHIFNASIASAYEQLRARYPKIHYRLVGGLAPASELDKWRVLAAADVFTSPADNLQETFGLTLLEAMMAELPLVVSDWNGYRDLVEHGSNGFLIPTRDVLGCLDGIDAIESDYASGRLNYDGMIGLRSLGVSVDHSSYVARLNNLLVDPGLCARMASASLQRLGRYFSPHAVCTAYRNLYGKLSELREEAALARPSQRVLPGSVPSYKKLFDHYATEKFSDASFDAPCEINASALARIAFTDMMNQQQLQRLASGRLADLLTYLDSRCFVSTPDLVALGFTRQQSLLLMAAMNKLGFLNLTRA